MSRDQETAGTSARSVLRVGLARETRVVDGGRVVLGGRPLRARRLSSRGGALLTTWVHGAAVGADADERALARRMLDEGILHVRPAPVERLASLTVVVPVRDRPQQLARCLDSVRTTCPGVPIIVVDDGSTDEHVIARAAGDARVIRLPRSVGAAAARNIGLRLTETQLVVFVDSDVVLTPLWAHRLASHFADPTVGAAAPRVEALPPAGGWIGGYEERHSPLDMGPRCGRVGPGRGTPYVPSAALMVRREAAGRGFDPTMEIGEDVDLVWRMDAAGWSVHYDPDARVLHDHRVRLRDFVSRRRTYAASVALLAKRHRRALPAVRLTAPMATPCVLALAGQPLAAWIVTTVIANRLGRRLAPVSDRPRRLAADIVARGLVRTALGLAQAVRRGWAPLLLLAGARSQRARLLVAAAFVAPVIEDGLATRKLVAFPGDALLRLVDEVVALWGTMEGCARERTVSPLLVAWEGRACR